jgi:hypothetical protein
MVQHNDKWKKKATRDYYRKHGTLPAGRGRGRGRGAAIENDPAQDISEQEVSGAKDEVTSDDDSNAESGDEETEIRIERSKYARRKIESNAWRFESEESNPSFGSHLLKLQLIEVIDETALEPPEPDYAHLPARPFETKKQPKNAKPSFTGAGHGKQYTIKEKELVPLKARIDKANAARAFKERFAPTQRGNVLTIGEDGIARRQRRENPDEEVDDEIDEIDTFLAELDMKGTSPLGWSLIYRLEFLI